MGLDKTTFAIRWDGAGAGALGDLTKRTHRPANEWQQATYVWRTISVPVIAANHGVAFGAASRLRWAPISATWRRMPASRSWKSTEALSPIWAGSP